MYAAGAKMLFLKVVASVQQVEEGILASNVPGVLDKAISDLLDLTDLVRGKLNAQVLLSTVAHCR